MKKKQILMLLGDLGILTAALLIPHVTKWMLESGPACIFAQMGALCPSCGATRCVFYFFTGSFFTAFAMNPFAFFMIVYVLAWLVFMNLHCFTRWQFPGKAAAFMLHYRTVITLAVAYAIFGILRNFL